MMAKLFSREYINFFIFLLTVYKDKSIEMGEWNQKLAMIPQMTKRKETIWKGEKIRLVISGFTGEKKLRDDYREQWSREWRTSKRSWDF